uniref:NUC194 domain-containing protein n=1 Tax=Macrostomum lignano TaxID=282301 RepID=A0A1I8GP88_9PLAT
FQPHQNQQQHPLGPLRALLACLECHLWSVGRGLLDPQQLLGCGSGSRLCQKLSDFFNETDPSLDPGRLALSASVSASSAYSNSISEIRASAVTIRCQLIVRTAALLQLLAGKQRDCLKELLQGKENLAPVGSSYRSSIVSAIAAELEPAGQSVTVQRLLPQSGLASDPPSVAGAVRLARGIRALRDCGLLADSTADEKRQILDRCCQLAESAQTTQQHPVLPQLIDAALTYALNDSALLQPLVTLLTEHSAGLDLLNSYKSCLTAYFSANCQSLLTILAASPLLKAATAPATAAATIARLPALAAILESLAASLWDYGNDDCRFSVLGILTNLLAVDAELVKSNDQVFVLFVGVLNSRVNGLALLGYMCRNPSTERAERLSSQLKLLCSETVLMRCSNQLGINSHAYCQYVRAFRALLLAQETSEHPLLLDILSILVCKERQHALEAEFQQCLNRLLLRIPVQRCRDSVLLDFVATDDCLEFCLTCLLNAQQSLAGFNESETEEIFLLARGCCRVLSCFYMACGLTELALPRLCDAFKRFYSRQPAAQKDPERSLSNWVSVQCYDLVTQSFPRCRESVRQMQCEAYNLLVHCIKAASDKERSYLPPFTENAAKRKFIFDNIVPTDVDYQLPLQVEVG